MSSSTEDPISGIELQEHEALSAGILRKIAAIDHSDLSLEAKRRERGQLEDLLRICGNSSTPVQHVPQEILRYIFLLSLPTFYHLRDFRPQTSTPPLSFAQVSRFWRSVAHSTPELWARFSIRSPKDVPYVKYWIKKAGPRSGLAIFYDTVHHGCPFDLKKISCQVQHLELQMPESKRHAKLLLAEPRFDSLVSLKIFVPPHPSTQFESPTNPLAPLSHAPRLRRLELQLNYQFCSRPNRIRPLFPWAHLTYLHLDYLYWTTFPLLLSLCINIQEAIFSIKMADASISEGDPQPVDENTGTLEHLRSLTVIIDDLLYPRMFKGLNIKHLRSLCVAASEQIHYPFWRVSWTEPTHLYSQLQHLEDLDFQHHPTLLAFILPFIPTLRRLKITTVEDMEQILQVLTINPGSPKQNVLPNLARLELKPLTKMSEKPVILISHMISSRLRKNVTSFCVPLEYVGVRIGDLQAWERVARVIRDVIGDDDLEFCY